MKKFIWMSVFVLGALFASCSDDDSPTTGSKVPAQIEAAFKQKFPDASNVSWESRSGGYMVASFTSNNETQKAWFDNNGTWNMTEKEIPFHAIPQAVRDGFNATEYSKAPWVLDDDEVDVLYREGAETLYVIEVEKKENGVETEMELYFTEDGLLVKEIVDVDHDDDFSNMLPKEIPSAIQSWLDANLPNARLIDIEKENGNIEVDVLYQGVEKEILFTAQYEWISTTYDIPVGAVPANVKAVVDTEYPGYYIDDAEIIETATGTQYKLELEAHNDNAPDIDIIIDEQGTIIKTKIDD